MVSCKSPLLFRVAGFALGPFRSQVLSWMVYDDDDDDLVWRASKVSHETPTHDQPSHLDAHAQRGGLVVLWLKVFLARGTTCACF